MKCIYIYRFIINVIKPVSLSLYIYIHITVNAIPASDSKQIHFAMLSEFEKRGLINTRLVSRLCLSLRQYITSVLVGIGFFGKYLDFSDF